MIARTSPSRAASRLLLVLALLACGVPARSAAPEYSGRELLELCAETTFDSVPGGPCRAYFEEALRDTDGRLWPRQRAACPPPSFDTREALALYRREARRYPDVLHVPARDLIQGMLLKFFPCTGT